MDAKTSEISVAEVDVSRRGYCRLCGARLEKNFVDLGMSPLCESFLRGDQVDQMEAYFPLRVLVCDRCFLVQLQEYVKPAEIFTEYAYFSSYSSSWIEHARQYCGSVVDRFGLGPQSRVVEVASNDGYLLQHFLPFGVPVLGIEPAANVAEAARRKNIPTLVEFFGLALARQLVKEGQPADLIIGNNVLAQVPELNDFVAGMACLLATNGVITLEFPHLERLIEENQFDTIYHEHFSYFSLVTIDRLVRRHGLKVFDVEKLVTHGGSLRVYLCQQSADHATSPRVNALLEHEREIGLEEIGTYTSFAAKVHRTKRQLLSFLIECKEQGATICGYGAPGKGNTLLNYCGIGTDFLDFTVDRNPYKHGRYTPGMHIPIYPVAAIDEVRPDYLLILPWNLKSEIAQQMRHVGSWGCKMIVPIPNVEVIDPRDIAP
ncbi:class I SAM-dependent methyltransferase [Bradyrhizobium sp. CCBAU 45384]|uniref:class I SAM-dependent methyltransferase n=1 Tax=Bradyrhizobium sp. CCBAU 45384 TaxID=858428 RepID=UPI002306C0D3|nr:class I SAM-dependent methyltransferase [Bradyrhizobium sp. CCBAU 45384]MDA9409906.1 SAM-dependent methyltransferase [Bradyrhizobium sp. CCBAU 45384]